MNELTLKLFPAVCAILFAIGGTGYKWVRRYLIPVLVFFAVNNPWVAIAVCIALHLPYGDSLKETPWKRYIVFGTFFLPFALVGWTTWILLSWLVTSILFIVSNSKWGEKLFPWWIVEPIMGYLIGITCIASI